MERDCVFGPDCGDAGVAVRVPRTYPSRAASAMIAS